MKLYIASDKKYWRGFTLIELLVTMSILAMLMLILYSVFNISLRGWQKSDNMLRVSTAARFALEQMSREISSAVVKGASSSYYCVGFDNASPSTWRANSIGDEFYFIAPLKPDNTDDGSDLCEVGYWLDGAGTTNPADDVLRRFYATDTRNNAGSKFDFDFSSGKSYEFAVGVTNLEVTFYDASNHEYQEWDSRLKGGPPAKVKIKITVQSGKGTQATNPDLVVQDFTTTVSLP